MSELSGSERYVGSGKVRSSEARELILLKSRANPDDEAGSPHLETPDAIRVCYITIRFPHPGETFAGVDLRALVRTGTKVRVHSLRPRHPQTDELLEKWALSGLEVTHLSWSDLLYAAFAVLRQPGLLRDVLKLAWVTKRKPGQFARTVLLLPRWLSIYKQIEEDRPDVVHLFWGHYPALVARLVQIRLPQVVTSIFLGAYDIDWSYPLSRPAATQADVVWTHSTANVPDLLAMGIDERRLQVAYRGLDLSRIPPARPKIAGRIVCAGRLRKFKGMDSVLNTFHRVLQSFPGASLVILGDGPERRRLEGLADTLGISSHVEFRGHVHHEEVLTEFALAEVMLFLSRKTSERLPNVVKEAMACCCYCVASATPGIDELIPDRDYGAVVQVDRPDEAARAVIEALGDNELRARAASNARAHVLEGFDSNVTMVRYAEVWRHLVDAKGDELPGERAEVHSRIRSRQ